VSRCACATAGPFRPPASRTCTSPPSCTDGRLDLRPAETSIAADRARWHGEFVQGVDQQDEPAPRVIG
jgi:hypothetical protein